MQCNKVIAILSFSLLVCFLGCGHQDGNSPLGITGSGQNGYGSLGGNNFSGVPDAQELIGTWRDNLDSPYYQQFKFSIDGSCEVWKINVETNVHEIGFYMLRCGEPSQLTVRSPHTYFYAPFYFDHGDLVFVGDGGNFIFHRIR